MTTDEKGLATFPAVGQGSKELSRKFNALPWLEIPVLPVIRNCEQMVHSWEEPLGSIFGC